MVYHKKNEDLRCHYCGNAVAAAGMPKLSQPPHQIFRQRYAEGGRTAAAAAGGACAAHGRDSTVAKFAHADILRRFADGAANVLIGTQMVAKGHDIPNVTLVGVLAADSTPSAGLQSVGRAFSLLTQATGRADAVTDGTCNLPDL